MRGLTGRLRPATVRAVQRPDEELAKSAPAGDDAGRATAR
jgi:hypothetical protein